MIAKLLGLTVMVLAAEKEISFDVGIPEAKLWK
jgi:hypothetical protein